MIRKIYGSILAAICLMGCGSSQKKIIPPPPVEAIAVNSGSSQSATVNTAFAAPLVAKVTTGGSCEQQMGTHNHSLRGSCEHTRHRTFECGFLSDVVAEWTCMPFRDCRCLCLNWRQE